MTIPVEINPLLASSSSYTIARSVRLRYNASAYLSRTPVAASNQQKWTWSAWVKRGGDADSTSNCHLFDAGYISTGVGATWFYIVLASNKVNVVYYNGVSNVVNLVTTAVLRDPSAWYHLVVALDTTQATASNRLSVYINGVQMTSFSTATYPALNATYPVNSTYQHRIGSRVADAFSSYQYFDGYLAEINFVDGQQLTSSSFGAFDNNGIWQPKAYAGTYGTNGFYLKFLDNSAATAAALGKDSSGNGNNWTPNNISVTAGVTYDSMLDSPTVSASASNYAVLNPLSTSNVYKPYDGNISYSNQSGATNWASSLSTIGMTSGKWYFETKISSASTFSSSYVIAGIQNMFVATDTYMGISASSWGWQGSATKYNAATGTSYGTAASSGDTIMVAFDADAGSLWFGLNGTWFASGSPSTGANPSFSSIPSGTYAFAVSSYSPSGNYGIHNVTFGQRPFAYTPPTGFLSLNTYNLSTPTINTGAQYMAASTYTGTGATQSIVNNGNNPAAVSFKPDFVWSKSRSNATNNTLFDSVRGVYNGLISNATNAEINDTASLTAFNSNGFTLGASNITLLPNYPSYTYIAWQWQAGQGTTTVNTSGTTTSNVSVNQSAGFSIVTCTASPSQTVGHGLGVAPRMIIVKSRTSASLDWYVYHASNGNTGYTLLNTTGAFVTNATVWNNTSPTSSVFTLGSGFVNASWGNIVAYCWSEVAGYSKFGSYTGNGAADGPFVYCGFRPRFVLIKDTTSAVTNWQILDTSRDTYNQVVNSLTPTSSAAEAAYGSSYGIDVTANGFKIRLAGSPINISTDTHIFAAFAENPFKISRAR